MITVYFFKRRTHPFYKVKERGKNHAENTGGSDRGHRGYAG